jgi:hypothetical protein
MKWKILIAVLVGALMLYLIGVFLGSRGIDIQWRGFH